MTTLPNPIPVGDLPDSLIVNGHGFIHVASCPCLRIQREVRRLEESTRGEYSRSFEDEPHEHSFVTCLDCDDYIIMHRQDDWSHRRCKFCNISEDDV